MSRVAAPVDDRQLLRSLYTTFPTGVTVVSTTNDAGVRFGMTASSFYSVSLAPPIVCISLTNSTPSYDAFADAAEIGISMLSIDQTAVARRFAMPSDDKFSDIELDESSPATPIIAGASAWLVARPTGTHVVGDHTLLFAEVTAARVRDTPPLVYHKGTFFTLAEQVSDEVSSLRQRGNRVGFIVDDEGRIALVRDSTGSESWSIPTGALTGGRSNLEALRATARRVLGSKVEPDFLYSIADVNDHMTCLYYRAHLEHPSTDSERAGWFAEDEIPWDRISTQSEVHLLRRYLRERVADQFGVFVNVGQGRVARIVSEGAWEPHR